MKIALPAKSKTDPVGIDENVNVILGEWITIGRNIDDYDHLTLAEMVFQIEVIKEKELADLKNELRHSIWLIHRMATAIHAPKDVQKITPEKEYPEFFEGEDELRKQQRFLRGVQNYKRGG